MVGIAQHEVLRGERVVLLRGSEFQRWCLAYKAKLFAHEGYDEGP